MESLIIQPIYVFEVALFLLVLFMHVTKSNSALNSAYALQSLAVVGVLFVLAYEEQSMILCIFAVATLVAKCFVMPKIIGTLIKKHSLRFASAPYLTTPTMLFLVLLVVLASNVILAPIFARLLPDAPLLSLVISPLFIALLLVVNRRDALSQIIGILAAENAIVVFAALLNVHAGLWLELGILADVFAWLLVGSTFVTVVTKHFGSTDVGNMKHLSD